MCSFATSDTVCTSGGHEKHRRVRARHRGREGGCAGPLDGRDVLLRVALQKVGGVVLRLGGDEQLVLDVILVHPGSARGKDDGRRGVRVRGGGVVPL